MTSPFKHDEDIRVVINGVWYHTIYSLARELKVGLHAAADIGYAHGHARKFGQNRLWSEQQLAEMKAGRRVVKKSRTGLRLRRPDPPRKKVTWIPPSSSNQR